MLGMGLLPSLTRKLHALDTSLLLTEAEEAQNVRAKFLDPHGKGKTQSVSFTYEGGMLILGLSHTVSPGEDTCVGQVTARVIRSAFFGKWVGMLYYQASAQHVRERIYKCINGQVVLISDATTPGALHTPISCGSSEIGTLDFYADGSASIFLASKGVDSPAFSPPSSFEELQVSVSCC